MTAEVPCPHCGEVLKVDPDALGSTLVCSKCHVILRLAKDDDKPSLFAKVRRLLRRKQLPSRGPSTVLVAITSKWVTPLARALCSASAAARTLLSTNVTNPSGPARCHAKTPLVPQPQPRSTTRSPGSTCITSARARAPLS